MGRQNSSAAAKLLLLFFIIIQIHSAFSTDEIPIAICSNTTNLDQSSVTDLFSALVSNAAVSKFFETSVGNGTVYGKFMCLNYATNEECRNCVSKAVNDTSVKCGLNDEAVTWEEKCQLEISRQNSTGKLGSLEKNRFQQNPENVSDPGTFGVIVNGTLNVIAKQAAFSSSEKFYATAEKDYLAMNRTFYSLVQCAGDLSADDCYLCLATAIADVRNCCSFSLGARILSPSCYLRYELYQFNGSNSARSSGGPSRRLIIALSIVIPCSIIAALCLWFLCSIKKWMERVEREQGRVPQPSEYFKRFINPNAKGPPFFDLGSLRDATDNFSDGMKLGQGGFGPVYKGVLKDGTEIAVKRLQENFSEQGLEEFRNEVLLIMKLQHNNLVKLLGFSAERNEKLLVYEYMPNSSLDVFLFDPNRRMQLDWSRRLDIITGIARGIVYLHEDCQQRIIHRDLKASNILLDADMNPKISDFGIARIFAGAEAAANTATIIGTYGYMAPEYAMEGLYSVKSDVFSFGVILLEIVTGKKNLDFSGSGQAPNLLAYAWQMWNEGNVLELIDPLLHSSCHDPEDFARCVHIGLLCVQEDPVDRPTMSSVAVMLKQESVALRQPQRPAFSVRRFTDYFNAKAEIDIDGLASVNGLTVSRVLPR